MNERKELLKKIDELKPNLVQWASEIVRFPSLAGQEKEAQGYISDQLRSLGFDHIDVWEPDMDTLRKHEAFISSRTDFKNSPNVVGTKHGKGGGRSLILNSHIDVVTEGDHNQWTNPPFGGVVSDGRIFGRGISDMKGTKAAMFTVFKAFEDLGVQLRGDITIESVIEEESGGSGSLACALRGYKADAALIPEPSGFAICPAQQGSTWFRVTVPGLSAHGGQRYKGVSAIENFVKIFPGIQAVEDDMNKRFASSLYADVPIPFAINLGTIRGGDWPSSVPESLVFEGRIGVPPGMELKETWSLFENEVENLAKSVPWLKDYPPQVEWWGAYWGSAMIDSDHPIVRTTESAFSEISGETPRIAGTPWATDARMLTEFAQTPALIFGPGTSAHCPDEFIPIDDLHRYAKMLALIIVDWCEVAE